MRTLAVCLIAFAFGFIGSIPLAGPVSIMALSRAARGQFDEARRIARGAALAEGAYASVAFWGFTRFLAHLPLIVPICHGAAGVLLTALGARFMVWRPVEGKGPPERQSGTTLLGFSVSALNPTLLLTWSTAVAFLYSKGLEGHDPVVALPFGAFAAAGVVAWFECFIALLQKYEGKVPRKALAWTVRAMGLLLAFLGIWSGVELVQWATRPRPPRAEHAATPLSSTGWVSPSPGAHLSRWS